MMVGSTGNEGAMSAFDTNTCMLNLKGFGKPGKKII